MRTKRPFIAAGVNGPLALLRYLLRLAHKEWEVLPAVPKIRQEREPQGRIRWLAWKIHERLKEKSHRAPRRCYRSGVEALRHTVARRLDGHRLYNPK